MIVCAFEHAQWRSVLNATPLNADVLVGVLVKCWYSFGRAQSQLRSCVSLRTLSGDGHLMPVSPVARRAGAAERVEQVEGLVLLQRQACADEGTLSFVATYYFLFYRDSPYKRE